MRIRKDPEPITILIAICGATGATVSVVNYWKTHHKPLPIKLRKRIKKLLDPLASELRYLKEDISALEGLFNDAPYQNGESTLQLGNGALLTAEDFDKYEFIADNVFNRLRRIHKLSMKVQKVAFDYPYIDHKEQTNMAGAAVENLDSLIHSRDYSVPQAWAKLKATVEIIEAQIDSLYSDLSSDGTRGT
tara:strand:- start:718 stop:1287 length:570 start_codon:yes stop_codon:yes gene_type:complete